MEENYKGLKIYQLILEGRYANHDQKAIYEDINIFSDMELLTPEYIAQQKENMTINAFDFMRWSKDAAIVNYIRTYNFVCEEGEII